MFKVCADCGANLDPCEKCLCDEQIQSFNFKTGTVNAGIFLTIGSSIVKELDKDVSGKGKGTIYGERAGACQMFAR